MKKAIKVGDLVEINPVRYLRKFQRSKYKRYLEKVGIVTYGPLPLACGRFHVYFPELNLSAWFVGDNVRSLCEEK